MCIFKLYTNNSSVDAHMYIHTHACLVVFVSGRVHVHEDANVHAHLQKKYMCICTVKKLYVSMRVPYTYGNIHVYAHVPAHVHVLSRRAEGGPNTIPTRNPMSIFIVALLPQY